MAANNITPEEGLLILKFRDQGMSLRGISAAMAGEGHDRPFQSIGRWLAAIGRPAEPTVDITKELKRIRRAAVSKNYLKCAPLPDIDNDTKILSLSDLHVPFHFEDVINHAIIHHADAGTIVLLGDLLEVYALSSWAKSKFIPLREEFNIASRLLDKLSKAFPRVVVIRGNHEERAARHFLKSLTPEVLPMVEYDILMSLCNGFKFDDNDGFSKVYDWDNVHYRGGPLAWFQQIGQCIFAHPSNASGAQFATMHTAVGAAVWFRNRSVDFDAVICGHSHKMGKSIWNGKLILEQGCCCMPLDYEGHPKLTYKSPQTFGYAVVHMDKKGRVDFNRTRNIYRGAGTLDPGKRLSP